MAGGRPPAIQALVADLPLDGDTSLFLGPPGTGKTHLAVALGQEAIWQNFSVQFVTAATLVGMMAKAQGDGTFCRGRNCSSSMRA